MGEARRKKLLYGITPEVLEKNRIKQTIAKMEEVAQSAWEHVAQDDESEVSWSEVSPKEKEDLYVVALAASMGEVGLALLRQHLADPWAPGTVADLIRSGSIRSVDPVDS